MINGCRRRKDVRGHNLSVKGMIEECIMAGRKQRKKGIKEELKTIRMDRRELSPLG